MNKILKRISIILLTIFISFIGINNIYAASATISISSSTNKVVVGNTFTVSIKISSSTALGSWEFTPSYNSSMLKLIDGETPIVKVAENGSTKSKTYSYKFKTLKTGNASITVKSYGAYAWDFSKLSISTPNTKTISIITQAQLEASYSKNNYLKTLSVEGLTLSPTFNKNTTSYTVDAGTNTNNIKIKASVEDSKSSLIGTGVQEVSEGENKFNITVTAQNGSTKTYTIIVNVVDPNPINVTINNKDYIVVKRESLLECPENYEKTTIEINSQQIPAFYNSLNSFTLVGLKDNESNIKYFIYNKDTNEYIEYNEITLKQLKIYPLEIDKEFDESYEKSTTTINDVEFDSLKIKNSEYSIIHAKDLLTGDNNYYLYDSLLNTIVRYTDENIKPLENELKTQKQLILLLGGETVLVIFILICILIAKVRRNKKKKKLYKLELEKRKQEEELKKQEEEKRKLEEEQNKQKEILENNKKSDTIDKVKTNKTKTKRKK